MYVDDLLLIGHVIHEINQVKQLLHDRFTIKDLGDVKYFLGMEVAHSSRGIALFQRKCAMELLQDTSLLAAKPASTPIDASLKLQKSGTATFEDASSYRRLIGRLLYLTSTKPDLSFAVSQLSQYLANKMVENCQTGRRVLRYVKTVPASGLLFPVDSDLKVTGFANSN